MCGVLGVVFISHISVQLQLGEYISPFAVTRVRYTRSALEKMPGKHKRPWPYATQLRATARTEHEVGNPAGTGSSRTVCLLLAADA